MPETFGLVVPTYQRPQYVIEAVRSALDQTIPFTQVVVVCDGAQQETEAALRELPVEVIVIDNAGVAAARNAGIAALSTDWACFLDDDDLLHPEYLERVQKRLGRSRHLRALNVHYWVFGGPGHPDVDYEADDYASAIAGIPDGDSPRDLTYMQIWGRSFDLLLERMRGSLSGSVVDRAVLAEAGGFPVGLRCAEDWTMYVNVARFHEWDTLTEPLVLFRKHPTGATLVGGVANGLDTLRAIRAFWEPSALPTPTHRALGAYAPAYRFVLRWALQICRDTGDRDSYREALQIARSILPRRRDRLIARIPPATWQRLRRGAGRR
ncbi:MAG: glycosyltransferase [Actinobacteria bacterium]|nr:glycosyltransferase [Actinomycetota bacterium]